MAARSNALSEIARFWLQECYGLFLRESVSVKLKRNNSDIDFIATSPAGAVTILDRIRVSKAIVETKDERDFDPHGTDFAKRLANDYKLLQGNCIISPETSCCFSMLRKEHHVEAEKIFGQGVDFSKIFIFHNLKKNGLEDILAELRNRDIHVVTSFEMMSDIQKFLKESRSGAGVRNSLTGDILDMLVTYHKWEQRGD
ncbi:MAG: hypothetical protein LBO64_10725 [Desulfovibrio sp.]|jgi:hypothetical protein|nr:hypothetical protein [Desulfovibrio sp.]